MRELLTTDPAAGVDVSDATAFINARVDAASTERQLELIIAFIAKLRTELEAVHDDDSDEEHFVRFESLKRLARMLCY